MFRPSMIIFKEEKTRSLRTQIVTEILERYPEIDPVRPKKKIQKRKMQKTDMKSAKIITLVILAVLGLAIGSGCQLFLKKKSPPKTPSKKSSETPIGKSLSIPQKILDK